MSTAILRQVLRASNVDATSEAIETVGMDNLIIAVTATVSAADLVASLTVRGAYANLAAMPALASGTKASVFPANITYTDATGVLAFASPTVETHQMLVKIVNPPPIVVVSYDHTSGGGAVDLIVRACGWKH